MLFSEVSDYFALKAEVREERLNENFHLDHVDEEDANDPELNKGIFDIVNRQSEIDEFFITTK